METLKKLEQEGYDAACEILEIANLKPGNLFVVGCSTSEIVGGKIGNASRKLHLQYLQEFTVQ